jgi:signal transduction protein with GAF and PtsI domain
MVCRANWGTSAPEVGTKLNIEHSFTGLCVRTGEPVRCDDAQTDPRVDPEACRALGISAVAAAPLRRGPEVIGVIAAFSDTPRAFTDKHVRILATISDVIVELLDDRQPVQPLSQIVEIAPGPARAAGIVQASVAPLVDKRPLLPSCCRNPPHRWPRLNWLLCLLQRERPSGPSRR